MLRDGGQGWSTIELSTSLRYKYSTQIPELVVVVGAFICSWMVSLSKGETMVPFLKMGRTEPRRLVNSRVPRALKC